MGLMDNTFIGASALVSQLITSISWSSFAQASLALLLGFYLYSYWRYRSFSFHKLPGPPADNYFLGILYSLLGSESEAPQTAWHAKYGSTLQTPFLPFPFYSSFQTTDPTALNYIVSHPDLFPKPKYIWTEIASVGGGEGLVMAEGDQHRKQRKVLNGCFTPAAIAGMVPTFYDKAYELREKLLEIVEGISDETPSLTPPQPMDQVAKGRKVDVMRYIMQATFDIIGLTGFGYQFNQLQQKGVEEDELSNRRWTCYGLRRETLNSSPYLDAFVREVIRLSPSIPSSTRSAKEDAVIPLRHPVVGRDGKMMNRVEIPKGTDIYISIIAINTSPLYYGPDAAEFNPDRFLSPQAENDIPGVWGGSMSFFAGPRSCIGYRFALAELKTILFVLINGFEFAELPSKPMMERRRATMMRARVVGEESVGPQMPLLVKALAF
ncbi:hypothetical protein L202_03767 [Cryptococcus amylolentus CBS 6039]|uniref:Cytochrome P450 n=2 Tax=Cryptococcus amylolentus TaxID=104669 RepID=A0A1E3HU47_9TREE|nr:hypothetical protein L202_03767 [Cryptococcus amylolentus CBS 6039]ODN79874.1 hypothetical protein L202_03767 [Cryptococcus amylolentus CBS 6039]ODO08139.1 hypothetical protein I350_03726 [Cryptococcus amylolentus CBS 6273]